MIYQYPTQFDVDILASSMLHVGTFDAEILKFPHPTSQPANEPSSQLNYLKPPNYRLNIVFLHLDNISFQLD